MANNRETFIITKIIGVCPTDGRRKIIYAHEVFFLIMGKMYAMNLLRSFKTMLMPRKKKISYKNKMKIFVSEEKNTLHFS